MKHEHQKIYTHPLTGRTVVETINEEPSMTQQQYKDECDINNIMKKYTSTGQFTHVTSKKGIYGDFSEIKDYQGMLDTVMMAQDAFATLPAEVRSRFRNDPGYLLDFLQDEKNYDEALKLGLVNEKIAASNDEQKLKPNDDKAAKQKQSTDPSTTPKA